MQIEDVKVGCEYRVEAPNTNSREVWTVKSIKGDEVTCKGSKTPYERTFLSSQLQEIHKKMAKPIVSESVKVVGEIHGKSMNIERIDYMPHHERRGRKSNG